MLDGGLFMGKEGQRLPGELSLVSLELQRNGAFLTICGVSGGLWELLGDGYLASRGRHGHVTVEHEIHP